MEFRLQAKKSDARVSYLKDDKGTYYVGISSNIDEAGVCCGFAYPMTRVVEQKINNEREAILCGLIEIWNHYNRYVENESDDSVSYLPLLREIKKRVGDMEAPSLFE